MEDIVLDFGKYNGTKIKDVDKQYLKYLLNVDYEYDNETEEIIIYDKAETKVNKIIDKSNYYIAECRFSEETKKLAISKKEWWNKLELMNEDDKAKTIYKNSKDFNVLQNALEFEEINFSDIYLRAVKNEVVKSCRRYVKENNLCYYCLEKMFDIEKLKKNIRYNNWNNKKYHKVCFNEIIKEHKN